MDKGKSLGQLILILSTGFFLTLFIAAILAQKAIDLPLGGQSINFSLLISLTILGAYAFVANRVLGKIDKLGGEETTSNLNGQERANKRPHPALDPDDKFGRDCFDAGCCKHKEIK